MRGFFARIDHGGEWKGGSRDRRGTLGWLKIATSGPKTRGRRGAGAEKGPPTLPWSINGGAPPTHFEVGYY